MGTAETVVVRPMTDEFQDEEPTKREITESLEKTIGRLRTETDPCERPTVRMRSLTRVPETHDA